MCVYELCVVAADTWVKEFGKIADRKGVSIAARIFLVGGAIATRYTVESTFGPVSPASNRAVISLLWGISRPRTMAGPSHFQRLAAASNGSL